MGVSVRILCDNLAAPPSFVGEHGLSVLVGTEKGLVLYDCGQSDAALRNARAMGVDLRQVDAVALSHAHYDHTGGLLDFLSEAGRKPVYAHPDLFVPRYFKAGGVRRFIGFPYSREALEESCSELVLGRDEVEIIPGVYLTGEIPVREGFLQVEPALFREKEGELATDDFPDDRSLVVDLGDGFAVVTGCAHVGIANIALYVREKFGRIRALIGGTHLGFAGEKALSRALEVLRDISPERLVFCHCTGVRLSGVFESEFGAGFSLGHAGMALELA